MIRFYRAFAESHLTCGTPYISRYKKDANMLSLIIRRTIKQTLRLSSKTSTERLEALGLYNNNEELIDTTLTPQYQRLSSSDTEQKLLDIFKIKEPLIYPPECVLVDMRENITIKLLPKHMHPDYNSSRRDARAHWFEGKYKPVGKVVYTIAAERNRHRKHSAVVMDGSTILTCASLYTTQSN